MGVQMLFVQMTTRQGLSAKLLSTASAKVQCESQQPVEE